MVRPSILTLMLLLASPALAATEVPRLDIQKTCRNEAKQDLIDQSTTKTCLSEETDARAQLEKEWGNFNASYRSFCLQEVNVGGDPSYVEMLMCLQMKRDAALPQPSMPSGQKSK